MYCRCPDLHRGRSCLGEHGGPIVRPIPQYYHKPTLTSEISLEPPNVWHDLSGLIKCAFRPQFGIHQFLQWWDVGVFSILESWLLLPRQTFFSGSHSTYHIFYPLQFVLHFLRSTTAISTKTCKITIEGSFTVLTTQFFGREIAKRIGKIN